MIYILMTVLFLVFSGLTPVAANDLYTQSYVILIDKEIAGTETVTEEKDSSGAVIFTSEHELSVSEGTAKNRMAFSTRMVFSRGARDLQTYFYRYKTGQTGNLEVFVRNDQITRILTSDGQALSEVTAPFTSNMVIVDYNVYYQYEHLIRRYDRRRRGAQAFANFIPLIGSDIPIKVTLLGDAILRFGEKDVEASRFQVELADIHTVTLSVDRNGRLVILENPTQGLQVIRRDLLP